MSVAYLVAIWDNAISASQIRLNVTVEVHGDQF